MPNYSCPTCKTPLQGRPGEKLTCPHCSQRVKLPLPPTTLPRTVLAVEKQPTPPVAAPVAELVPEESGEGQRRRSARRSWRRSLVEWAAAFLFVLGCAGIWIWSERLQAQSWYVLQRLPFLLPLVYPVCAVLLILCALKYLRRGDG